MTAGPRPAAVGVVVVWAAVLAAGLVVGAAVVVVHEWVPVTSWENNFVDRGVLVVAELLVAMALMLGFGARALWRTGRRVLVSSPFVLLLLAAVWGAVDSLVERSAGSALVAAGCLAAGGVPLLLLRSAPVRAWVGSMPRPPRDPRATRLAAEWQDRLSPAAARHLLVVQLARLTAWLSFVVLFVSWAIGGIDGPTTGWVLAAVGASGFVASIVVWRRSMRAARDDLAAQHGLPPGSCRWVEFGDLVVFDATLARAVRTHGSPTDRPSAVVAPLGP